MGTPVSSYPSVLLGDVCRFIGGGTPSRKREDYYKGNIPWATVKDFKTYWITDTEDHITEAGLDDSASNLIPSGAVLLVTRVGLGKVAIAGRPMAINQDIKAVIPSTEILPEFLFWFLLSKGPEIQRIGTGATVKGVTLNDVRSISMPLPPLADQQRIIDILSRAEGIVRLRREAQKKAAEIIPALFIDMFGDPATNPKGWPVANLDAVAQIISGVTKGRKLDPTELIELPYMRVANVKDGYLDLSEVKTIAVRDKEIEKYRLLPGDLLMTEGGDPDKLGRAAIWNGEIDVCLHQNHIFKVRPDPEQLLPEYLRELAGSSYGKAYFLRVAKKTTGIATINRTQLGKFPVLIPSIEYQREFVRKFEAVKSIQTQQASATLKAEDNFNALLSQFFQ